MSDLIYIRVGESHVRLDRIESWSEYKGEVDHYPALGCIPASKVVVDEPGGVEVVTFNGLRYVDRDTTVDEFTQRVIAANRASAPSPFADDPLPT